MANDGKDACPTVKGTLPNGCQPSISSIDPDGDGLFGDKDKCPTLAKPGAGNGCPTLTAALGKLPKFKRSKLAKGVKFPVTCSLDSAATADLTVSKSVAKKLKLKVKRGAKTVTIGSAKGACNATGGGKLKLKLTKKAKKPVTKSKKAVKANLTVTFAAPEGVAPVTTAKSIKLK